MRSGTIGVCVDELSRYSVNAVSLFATRTTPNWTIRYAMGRNIAKNCNQLVRKFEGDLLWLQADDHVWPVDTLERLEAHGVDCVVPLILMRQRPFHPCIFEGEDEPGRFRVMQEPPPNELIEVHAAGTGGMLISREALEAVGPDPFAFEMLAHGEFLGEDLAFCRKLRKAGIKIHCDTGVFMGHLTTFAVWPAHTDEGWSLRLDANSAGA